MLSRLKGSKKGQELSFDLIMATAAFVFIMMLLLVEYQVSFGRVSELEEEIKIKEAAHLCSEQLLKSRGDPVNWHLASGIDEIHSIGLVYNENNLNWNKVQKFSQLYVNNSQQMKEMLGVGAYGLSVEITEVETKVQYRIGETFRENENRTMHYVVERMALMNKSVVKMQVSIWK